MPKACKINQHYCDWTKVKQFFGQCIKAVHVEANRENNNNQQSCQVNQKCIQITLEMDETCPKNLSSKEF